MKRKMIVPIVLLIAILGGGWYGFGEYNRKPKDLLKTKADISTAAAALIEEFATNEKEANAKYLDKIILVSGNVKSIEQNEQGFYTIVLAEENCKSSVRCSMDNSHQKIIKGIKPGYLLKVKGVCTGYSADELLGSDIILNRSVVQL